MRWSNKGAWKLLAFLRGYYRSMLLATGSGIAHQFLTMACAGMTAYLVGKAAFGAAAGELLPPFALLVILAVGRAALAWAEMYLIHDAAYAILSDLRIRVYEALERLAPGYLVRRRSGELAATAMSDVETLEMFYAHTIGSFVIALLVPAGTLTVLALLHPLFLLVLLPWLLLQATVPLWLRRLAASQGQAVRTLLGKLHAEVVDGVQGLREIVSFGFQTRYLARLREQNDRLSAAELGFARRAGLEGASIHLFTALGLLCSILLSIHLVSNGEMNRALFPVAILLAAFSFGPVAEVIGTVRNLGTVWAAGNRIFDILDAKPSVTDPVRPAGDPRTPCDIQFDAVSFAYEGASERTLESVSFRVEAGRSLALVGPSGAGKSTCLHLLMRFWDVAAGEIRIGGIDIRELKQEKLHELVSIVPQDVYLFHASIRDNIRLGKPEAADAEIEAAAMAACCHEFIVQLPEGYETNAGERAVQLSGGQRQRIALARAFLKNAPILLMDEATSSLDADNEHAVQQAIKQVGQGKTVVMITHRMSTLRLMDSIIVLDGGKVKANDCGMVANCNNYY